MSFIEITRTLRSLTQAPGRLFLTLLGIVIGSAAIVLVMSLLEGGKSALIRTNQGVTGADLVVVSGKRLPERARLLGRSFPERTERRWRRLGSCRTAASMRTPAGTPARTFAARTSACGW